MAQIYGIIRIGDRLTRKKCVEGLLVDENKKGYASVTYPSFLEPLVGFEPTTPRLQITCSGQLS